MVDNDRSSGFSTDSGILAHSIECLSCAQARTLVRALDRAAIVAITDRKGTIIYANKNFEEISGFDSEELIGSNHRLLNSGRHPKSFWTEMYRQVSGGRVWRGEVCNRSKSGDEYWVDTTITGMRDDDGVIRQYVAIRFDITDRKSAERELHETKSSLERALRTADQLNEDLEDNYGKLLEANAVAESAARAKSDFLANMSHEIRTPMSAIVGFAEILADEEEHRVSAEERSQYLHTICRQGQHLLCLINDILDLAKIESGMLCTEQITFDPHSVLQDMSQMFAHRAQSKGIELLCVEDPGVPTAIESDPTRLQQILTNLIGNAIKFTHDGTVEIRLRPWRDSDQEAIDFVVRDTGVGMAQRTISRLFRPFEQADASTTRKYGGTGLGLCICKKLATALGGEISVESELGAGSTFTLRLPLRNADRLPASDDKASGADAARGTGVRPERGTATEPLHGVRVLLAEDSDDNALLFTHHLKRAGAIVTRVSNGLEAVELICADSRGARPGSDADVVIMDMQMPVMDGYMATSDLRARGCELPIIAATAHAMEEDRRKCIEAGCTDYISKPVSRMILLNTVIGAIGRRGLSAAS